MGKGKQCLGEGEITSQRKLPRSELILSHRLGRTWLMPFSCGHEEVQRLILSRWMYHQRGIYAGGLVGESVQPWNDDCP